MGLSLLSYSVSSIYFLFILPYLCGYKTKTSHSGMTPSILTRLVYFCCKMCWSLPKQSKIIIELFTKGITPSSKQTNIVLPNLFLFLEKYPISCISAKSFQKTCFI